MDPIHNSAYRWPILVCLFSINLILNGFVHMILPPLFPEIAGELGLDYTDIGSAWGGHSLGMLLFSLAGGVAADRFGVKAVLSIALVAAAIAAGARGWVSSFTNLWLSMFLLGASYGFIIPNLTKCIGVWFGPGELGRANGILLMGFSIGSSLGMALGAPLGNVLGSWRMVMLCSGVLVLILWLGWLVIAREPEAQPNDVRDKTAPRSLVSGLAIVFRIKDLWLICVAELFIVGSFIAIMGLMPTYLVESGLSKTRAGLVTSLSTWTSIFGYFLGPFLSDRVGLRKIFTWPFLLIHAGCLLGVASFQGWPLYVAWGLAGFLHAFAVPIIRTSIVELPEIGPALSGSAFGGIFTSNRIGGFIIPWSMGLIMTLSNFPAVGFYFIAGISAIPPLLILFIRETGPGRLVKG